MMARSSPFARSRDDASEGGRRRLAFAHPLLFLSGADIPTIRRVGEEVRYSVLGLLVLLISLWSGSMLALATVVSLSLPLWVGIGLGAFYFLFILTLDRLINGQPLMRDDWKYRIKNVLLVRGLFGMVVALVVTHSALVAIWSGEISERLGNGADAAVTAYEERENSTSREAEQIVAQNALRTAAEAATAVAYANWQAAEATWQCEFNNGCVTGTPGRGPEEQRLKGVADDMKAIYDSALTAQNTTAATVATATTTLQNQINDRVADYRDDQEKAQGLAARSAEVWKMIGEDWSNLLWVLFFLLLDIAVVLQKTVLRASRVDLDERDKDASIRRRIDEEAQSEHPKRVIDASLKADADTKIDAINLERDLALAETAAIREQIPAMVAENLAARTAARNPQAGVPRRRARASSGSKRSSRARWAPAALLVVTALGATALLAGSSRDDAPSAGTDLVATAMDGGISYGLQDDATVFVPDGAISGGAPVTASYPTDTPDWPGHMSLADTVALETEGSIADPVTITFPVPDDQVEQARAGLLDIAYYNEQTFGWEAVPTTFDPTTQTISAQTTHFSWWNPFSWDWPGIGANVSQWIGERTGARSDKRPDCSAYRNVTDANWLFDLNGVDNTSGTGIRSCAGINGEGNLVIEMVNNRRGGVMLDYGGANVAFGWHQPAESINDAIRDAVGDQFAKHRGTLYIPPLSRASVGIRPMADGQQIMMRAWPTAGTVIADTWSVLAGNVLDRLGKKGAGKFIEDTFKQALAGGCLQTLFSTQNWLTIETLTSPPKLFDLLTSVAPCLEQAFIQQGRNMLASGTANWTLEDLNAVGGRVELMKALGRADIYRTGYNIGQQVADYLVDAHVIGLDPTIGWGFRLWGRIAPPVETPAPPVETPAPPVETPAPPVETPAPPVGTPAPPVGTPAPPVGTPAPPVGTPAPPVGTPAPPVGTPAPPAGTPAPPVETPAPPVETPAPPVETPAPPVETPAPPVGATIEDAFYGGTWARTDPADGSWHTQGDRPNNAAYWFPNGLGVAIDCVTQGGAYNVRFDDGRKEVWMWWAHVTDGTYVPMATLREYITDGTHGLPTC
jgi:hypothetical protein